ncbi:NC domain/GUN4 [Nostoc sp. T09]|uniref:GUN4 domain-containing protein n=1 Tax=Nostoc sp. T09 TaxID=1932621 RepID=UPI000A3BA290|nr:GUN4 domain-containing protein [Nostoc sp. T09]OUL37499.1 NC domain/GUN4 [Nostoc sp. T09]
MTIADHIYIECHFIGVVPYTHHGIDCGDGTVIHYSDGCIRRVSIHEFSLGKKIYKKHYDDCDSSDIVILRAESRLGEGEYNLFSNNCEHFASWCKTGFEDPKQVKPILGLLDFFKWRIQYAERQKYQKLISTQNDIIKQFNSDLKQQDGESQHYQDLISKQNDLLTKLNFQLKQQDEEQRKTSQEKSLITDKFDYRILQNLLREGYWQEADELTLYAMLKISSRDNDRYFRPTDISNFPREHLLIIDKLWREYSGNLFGFTVQKEIYQTLGGNQNYQHEIWEKFSENVGWRMNDVPLSYEQLNFSRNAVKGHLPHGKRIGSEVIGFLTII